MSLFKLASMGIKKSHHGELHEYLGIPLDQKIPINIIQEKLKTENDPKRKKQLNYALMAKTRWHHKGD